jgi:hypothetical protein
MCNRITCSADYAVTYSVRHFYLRGTLVAGESDLRSILRPRSNHYPRYRRRPIPTNGEKLFSVAERGCERGEKELGLCNASANTVSSG